MSSTDSDDALRRRRELKRRLGFVVVAVFVALGYFLFSARMPKDVTIRFELPPTVRGAAGALGRGEVVALEGDVFDEHGQRTATFTIPSPRGLDGPISAPVGVQLVNGDYRVEVRAVGHLGREVALRGRLTVDGSGEQRVDLRSAD